MRHWKQVAVPAISEPTFWKTQKTVCGWSPVFCRRFSPSVCWACCRRCILPFLILLNTSFIPLRCLSRCIAGRPVSGHNDCRNVSAGSFCYQCSAGDPICRAVCCISEWLFFSAVIPCILSTKISVKVGDLIVLWIERVILSILLAGIVALIAL